MKTTLFSGVALVAFVLFGATAQADSMDAPVSGFKPYVSVFAGASMAQDVKSSLSNTFDYSLGLKTGYLIGGAVGVQFNDMFRAEVELSHASWDANNTVSAGPALAFTYAADGKISATYLMGNLWLDFKNDSLFTPYAGGGIGAGWAEGDSHFDNAAFGYGKANVGLAYQLGAGVKFDVSETMAVDLGYRYKSIVDIDFADLDGSGSYNGADLNSHNIQLGLTLKF